MHNADLLFPHGFHRDLAKSCIVLQPLQLAGHHGEVSALAFGQRSRPILLCSASADYVIVWDIEQCQRKTQEGQKIANMSQQPALSYTNHQLNMLLAGEVAAGTVIGTLLGKVVHLSFCASDERVAACSGATVHVLSSKARNFTACPSHVNICGTCTFLEQNVLEKRKVL